MIRTHIYSKFYEHLNSLFLYSLIFPLSLFSLPPSRSLTLSLSNSHTLEFLLLTKMEEVTTAQTTTVGFSLKIPVQLCLAPQKA